MRYLIKVKVYKHGNAWTMNSDKGGTRVFNGTIEEFAAFLRRIQAKDDAESPRSYRSRTYMAIAQEIADGSDNVIYVWAHKWPDRKKSLKVYSTKIGEAMNLNEAIEKGKSDATIGERLSEKKLKESDESLKENGMRDISKAIQEGVEDASIGKKLIEGAISNMGAYRGKLFRLLNEMIVDRNIDPDAALLTFQEVLAEKEALFRKKGYQDDANDLDRLSRMIDKVIRDWRA